MSTLVTGVAGFIGMHTAKSLLSKGHHVVGIDNLNHYYDPRLKEARLTQLESFGEFSFLKTVSWTKNKQFQKLIEVLKLFFSCFVFVFAV